jgi:hypothetical protein
MGYKELLIAFSMIFATSGVSAMQSDPSQEPGAPAASPDARYCLRVEPVTGSRVETIRCETREGWSDLDVNVDQEWADNGVRVISSNGLNT